MDFRIVPDWHYAVSFSYIGVRRRPETEYKAGFEAAQYDLLYPNVDIAWEQKQDRASIDISKWKKFYYRGFKRGRAGKAE